MRKFICFMLTLLGFGAVVGCEEDEVVPAPEYGAPYVVYRVSARVVDEGDGWCSGGCEANVDDVVLTAIDEAQSDE